jgi:quercetin dioxygenase-like cupin family protein
MTRHTTITGCALGLALSAILIAGCSSSPSAEQGDSEPIAVAAPTAAPGERIEVIRAEDREPAPGDADFFTGEVTVDELFAANDDSTASAGSVSFEPGVRTAWHTHPAGQRLIITDGTGWVREEGQERRTVSGATSSGSPPGSSTGTEPRARNR